MSVQAKMDSGNGTLQISVSGRFDFGIHQQFRQVTDVGAQVIKQIELDLARTEYLDSSALGMLLVLRDKVGENKNAVKIKNAKPDVVKILKIANFDKLFSII